MAYMQGKHGYPDGSSGVLYPKDAQVATLTTDKLEMQVYPVSILENTM